MNDDKEVRVVPPGNIDKVQMVSIRGALRLETHGLRRSAGREPMLKRVNSLMGTRFRTARDAYPVFDAWLAENYGIEPSPLARRHPVRHAETPYDPSTDDGTTFYGEGLDVPSYGD